MAISVSIFLLLTGSVLVLSVPLPDTDSAASREEAELEQIPLSCRIENNRTLRQSFYDSVKQKHDGETSTPVRTFLVQVESMSSVRCFSQLDCPDTDFVWCFNLFNPNKTIEICWDSSSNVINMTDDAELLGLDEYFTVGTNCRGILGKPCIAAHSVPFFLEGGLLTCTSHNATCSAKGFTRIDVIVSGFLPEPPAITYHNMTNELVLGQQNVYYMTARFPSDIFLSGSSDLGIYAYGNDTFIDSIPENPFCPTCSGPASSLYDARKKNRLRVYTYSTFRSHCPTDLVVFHTWLVIDDAQESDILSPFIYKASLVVGFFRTRVSSSIELNLTAVLPLIDLVSLSTPSPTASNSSVKLGDSVQWSCSVQAGIEDRLVWLIDGTEFAAAADNDTNKEFNCSMEDIGYHISYGKPRVVSQYVRVYTAALTLCNISSQLDGLYECAVLRSRGEESRVPLWSKQIQFGEQPSTEPTTATTFVTTTSTQGPLISAPVLTYIVVGAFIFMLLITVVITLILVASCIRVARRNKRFKSRRPTKKNAIVMLSANEMGEKSYMWNQELRVGLSDELEFPRNKLVVLDQVLGKGTFGLVLLAKAEGIVRDKPDRNVVAVKTHKASAPGYEKDNLWEELELMKKMKPHPNILNLLGYCREAPGSPLYLIVEYAVYGSLNTFLKECEDVVLRLNHVPHVFHKNGLHQSCSSCSSTFANLSPRSTSQIPVFSNGTPTSDKQTQLLSEREAVSEGTPWPNATNIMFGTKFDFSSAQALDAQRERLSTQDSGVDEDMNETSHSAAVNFDQVSYSPAPVTHDYINSKGLLYMEDVKSFALQIACGLKHLEEIKVVHSDLAARNILIAEGFVLKIGDFGMARDISEKEYYRKSGGQIPVKWTAPEALEHHVFTYKSDIWSFGVTLWEIFSYGQRPFSDVKIGQSWEPFIKSLKNGDRLPHPNGCPDTFYKLMQQCWQISPDRRPSAADLIEIITNYSDSDKSARPSIITMETDSLHEECSPSGEDQSLIEDEQTRPSSPVSENCAAASDRQEQLDASTNDVTAVDEVKQCPRKVGAHILTTSRETQI